MSTPAWQAVMAEERDTGKRPRRLFPGWVGQRKVEAMITVDGNRSWAEVHAAWLRFPGFTPERLDQIYTRISAGIYRYESSGGFVAELTVNDAGLPVSYGDFWTSEANGGAD